MIRDYKPEDYPQLKKLLQEAKMYYEPIDNQKALKDKIKNFPGSIIVYENNGQIIGCCYFTIDPVHEMVLHLCVAKKHRGKGIGTVIMQEVENRIMTMSNKREPILLVEEDNKRTIKFYKKLGWKPHENKKYFMMKKKLS